MRAVVRRLVVLSVRLSAIPVRSPDRRNSSRAPWTLPSVPPVSIAPSASLRRVPPFLLAPSSIPIILAPPPNPARRPLAHRLAPRARLFRVRHAPLDLPEIGPLANHSRSYMSPRRRPPFGSVKSPSLSMMPIQIEAVQPQRPLVVQSETRPPTRPRPAVTVFLSLAQGRRGDGGAMMMVPR
jgi:hypothetical protein